MIKKKILAITGSTRHHSSNYKILKFISEQTTDVLDLTIFEGIAQIPHFNPDLDTDSPPKKVAAFRTKIAKADGVLICTPEYVFSLPGSLKNALEWCVSTTLFSKKQVGLITASASGEKGHEELQLIMKTIEAKFDEDTALLIQGVRGKVTADGAITDETTLKNLKKFMDGI
jgi:NAD(P)H-dependent FMN reductase